MSDQEVGISGDVNFPVPAVDGRDSNGYLPGYRSGTKVRVQGSAHIVQGDKIMAVVYARNANRTRFEIGEKTVSSTDLTIDVSGSRLEQIRSTTADWDFFIAVNRGSTNIGYSPTVRLYLGRILKDGSDGDSEVSA
ncbi:hypothetical protein G3436_13890 [Pseudomonas sp. MAFF212427]|uniref:Uncharacterized protein n=1 Tax=Pseudomonas brassicae TaxID=2708063 RepID=A0A6B3NSR8_9PSED|nr:hypothetical protein [Pseudomonas brassicae]NER64763.1 hypothetical protein [Pseudomonas brassicae]